MSRITLTNCLNASEIIALRSDPSAPNMGLTSWKGTIVRKGDVVTAKNYLSSSEIKELDQIVTMYLDCAEDQAKRRRQMTMSGWSAKLDASRRQRAAIEADNEDLAALTKLVRDEEE